MDELLSVTAEMKRCSAPLFRGLSTSSPDTDVEADTAPSALAFAGTRGVPPIATIDGDPVAFDADITSSPTTSSPRKRSPFATTHLHTRCPGGGLAPSSNNPRLIPESRFLTGRFIVTTTDYHTAGEPFRIVTGGVPEIVGTTVLRRREFAAGSEDVDAVRRLLCHEPRGHADMYGCFLVPADDPGADFGVLFWHKDGYSTACGHGTIALGAWAVESGIVDAADDGETAVTIDVPSGRVVARVRRRHGLTESVAFENVPSFVIAREVPAGPVVADVAYGGAIYASVPAAAFGLRVAPGDLTGLIAAGREVKRALRDSDVARHPGDERLSGIYGTILYDELGPLHQRNVTIFADGEVDRSPCGSGTSARCALLHADGQLGEGDVFRHDGIAGGTFTARVLSASSDGVVTEVTGMAYKTGEHRFVLDPRDPIGTGFVLR